MSQNNSTTQKIIKTNKKHIGEHKKHLYSGKKWKRFGVPISRSGSIFYA